jgi:amino acid transporter
MDGGRFKRRLNLLDLTFLGLGSIIGSGWLFASFHGASKAGSLAWLAWIIAAIAVILIGIVYGEIAAAIPRAGGFVRYPEYTHGSLVGFMTGFACMLAYSSVAGIEVEAVRGYASHWWPGLQNPDGNPSATGLILQFGLLILFFLLNYWSVQIFGKVNTIITTIKFLVPLLTIIVLLTQFHASNFSVGGADPGGIDGVFRAVSTGGIVFAFLGFRQAVDFGAEAKNPQRDIPRAIILAVTLATAIYLLLQISFLGAVPSGNLANGWVNLKFENAPFADLAVALGMGWLATVIFVDAIISPSGTGNIYMSGTARTLYAWSKNGHFYSIFGKVDKRTGIPRGAMWLTFILAAIWTLPLQFQAWSGLVNAVTSATVMTYMVGPVSASSLRETSPDLHRPFKLKWLGFLAPLAFIAATCIIYWSGWDTNKYLIGLTLFGTVILYFAFMDRNEATREKVRAEWKHGIWLVVYYLFIAVMSYIGAYTGSGMKSYIPYPWDTVVVIVGALVFYYWGKASALSKPVITPDEESEAAAASEVH